MKDDITTAIALVRNALHQAFDTLDLWFEKPLELRQYQPVNGGWTIDQILEHITLTNHFLLILIDKGRSKALHLAGADAEKVKQTLQHYRFSSEQLREVGIHGAFAWIRPSHMEPTGEKTPDEVRNLLQTQRTQCLQTLEALKNGEGVLYKTTMTVNNLGKLDVYQYIYFLCLHAKRHLTQMEKVEEEAVNVFNNQKRD
jgi:hypothetical protein